MSLDFETISAWVQSVTGYDDQHVIQANQTGPRPSIPYATIGPSTDETEFFPNVKRTKKPWAGPGPDPDPTILVENTFQRENVITINVYSDDGENVLSALETSMHLWEPRMLLMEAGIALQGKGTTRNLTRFEDTKYLSRFLSDFIFLSYSKNKEEVEEITEFDLGVEME
jgi:hypothetical protein